jgi:hypothetical protein
MLNAKFPAGLENTFSRPSRPRNWTARFEPDSRVTNFTRNGDKQFKTRFVESDVDISGQNSA